MPYRIKGAKRDTGEDVVAISHADNEADARASAANENILIESIEHITSPEPEKYVAVRSCGSIMFVIGWISIVGGAILAFVALASLDSYRARDEASPMSLFASAIATAFIGIFQLGLGSLLHMLRDTAIHIQSK